MPNTAQRPGRLPSVRVVERVADEAGVAAVELAPLYETLDPDALDAFVGAASTDPGGPAQVSFTYEGYRVTVDRDGDVGVSSLDD